MENSADERAVLLGRYIVSHGATVRSTAKAHAVSKSTVHKDVGCRLKSLNPSLYREVKVVLQKNKEERHLRGGLATKEKYLRLKINQ